MRQSHPLSMFGHDWIPCHLKALYGAAELSAVAPARYVRFIAEIKMNAHENDIV